MFNAFWVPIEHSRQLYKKILEGGTGPSGSAPESIGTIFSLGIKQPVEAVGVFTFQRYKMTSNAIGMAPLFPET